MKKLFGILVVLVVVIVVYFLFLRRNDARVEIYLDSCVDGDTAWFIIDGTREKVRFLGIDAPESVHPNGIIEEYGVEASNYTCDLLKNANHIYLEYDSHSEKVDKYGRVLGWVFVDKDNLSRLLVSRGYAKVEYIYGDYFYLDDLCLDEYEAYMKEKGIWSNLDTRNQYLNGYCNKN